MVGDAGDLGGLRLSAVLAGQPDALCSSLVFVVTNSGVDAGEACPAAGVASRVGALSSSARPRVRGVGPSSRWCALHTVLTREHLTGLDPCLVSRATTGPASRGVRDGAEDEEHQSLTLVPCSHLGRRVLT